MAGYTTLMMAKVSILIPCYNSQTHLKQCIESALNQGVNKEIILLDDGSVDNTLDIAKDYPITIVSREHKGFTDTYNELFSLSSGDWIQYLDSDDYLDKNKLKEQIKYCNIASDVLIGTTNVIEKDKVFVRRPNPKLLTELTVGIKYQTNSFLFSREVCDRLISKNGILWKPVEINHDTNLILDLIEIGAKFRLTLDSISFYRHKWSETQLTSLYKKEDKATKKRVNYIHQNFFFNCVI